MGTDFGLAMESMQVDEVDPYTELKADLEHADEISLPKPVSDALGQEAVGIYRKIIFLDDNSDGAIKIKEKAVTNLGKLHSVQANAGAIGDLLKELRPVFVAFPKAKTAKLVRTLLDAMSKVPDSLELQLSLVKESVEWTIAEKRTFLRQRLQTKLCELLRIKKEYPQALELLDGLIKEAKRLDDKNLLIEIFLIETRVHYELSNVARAKGSLTGARAAANATYCPPMLQAEIDFLGGVLCAEEKDYKTGFSYFYEAFETYTINENEESNATRCLKNMVLCKIMMGQKDEVAGILNGKSALKYVGIDLDAMRAISQAYNDRSLKAFEQALVDYEKQLKGDLFIKSHLQDLYDKLLEENLVRIIEPYSKVEIEQVAKVIELPLNTIHKKLSQMILDKKFRGILDQGNGCLIVYDDQPEDKTYKAAVGSIGNMEN